MNNNDKEIVKNDYLVELKNTQEMCKLLMQTKHYDTIGAVGVFAIVETAKSLGIDPRLALGGGLYYTRGKVEMSSRMMNALIRAQKHSVTRDKRSDDTICILHGKRSDTNDMWSESFSIEDAKKAGIYGSRGPWQTYTRDMLFARALSRLARQLFPDIIGNCYVEGEISLDPSIKEPKTKHVDIKSVTQNDSETVVEVVADLRTDEEVKTLMDLFNVVPDYKKTIELFLRKKEILSLKEMPKEMYSKVVKIAREKVQEYVSSLQTKFSNKELEVANA